MKNATSLLRHGLSGLVCLLVAAAAVAADRGADGKFSKRTSSHFVLFQDVDIDETAGLRGSRHFEDEVLAALEAAYRGVDQRLGMRPRRPITVSVWDPALFDQNFSGLFRFPTAGFYGDSIHVRGATTVDARLIRVLNHELVHASFHAESPSLVLPAWFNEGVAEWFEAVATGYPQLAPSQVAYLQRLARGGALYSLAQLSGPNFGDLGTNGASAAYLQSRAFIGFLASQHGERRVREMIRDVVRSGDIDRAFRRRFRSDVAELEGRWRRSLGG